ncbi:protein sld2 [Aspergillus stella-maris]|uniref:protein sld2 n=1 Tax=Aspergillus stella-maris TaxID=1810926 RepID=UPI003CCD6BF0
MATVAAPEIASHATALRAELKEWERAFAAANDGRRAGRADIKNNPEIAAKYKEYSRLKAQESKPEKSQTKSKLFDDHERSRKRKHSSPNGPDQTASTPRKQTSNIFQTPSKTRTSHPADVDPYDSPSVLRRLFSPSTHMQQSSSPLKTAIGPTPQRDGKALGLFDLLSESGGSTATPSAARIASIKGMDAVTPSKKRKTMSMGMDTIVEEDEGEDQEEEDMGRGERTPASSGKKYMLSALFATPTAWRYSSIVEDEQRNGPNNAVQNPIQSPLRATGHENDSNPTLETPSFLRRSTSNLNNMVNTTGLSPIPVRKPPLFPGRGLSQIVQGLRDMEEERMDDELDVLREMENEAFGPGGDVGVPDSQMGGENNTRTFKKKGQKRTTRLVKMRPVVAPKPAPAATRSQSQSQSKPQPQSRSQQASTQNKNASDDEYGDEDDLLAIAETQINAPTDPSGPEKDEDDDWDTHSLHSISEPPSDNDSDSDPEYGSSNTKPKRLGLGRTKSFSEKMKEAIGDNRGTTKQAPKGEKEEKPLGKENKKQPAERERKINANAHSHANYRSLKIRRGGRGGGRGFGRFRRR